MVTEQILYDLNIFKLIETCFVSKYMVYPGKRSTAHEKNMYPATVGWNVPYVSVGCSCFILLFTSSVYFLIDPHERTAQVRRAAPQSLAAWLGLRWRRGGPLELGKFSAREGRI